MDQTIIEKFDARRYKYLLWQTIGFGVLFLTLILFVTSIHELPLIRGRTAIIVLATIESLGLIAVLVSTFKMAALSRKIKSKPELDRALNNEMYRDYGYRALKYGYFITLVSTAVIFFITRWMVDIPAQTVCLIIIYIACLSLMIARLIYLNR